MIKKKLLRPKKTGFEDKVVDIYGVHFKYDDLYNRLLKVQKERQLSEEKIQIPRLASFDKKQFRQGSFNVKRKTLKKHSSNNIIFLTTNDRNSSTNRENAKQTMTSRIKPAIAKSPELKKPKKKVNNLKVTSKFSKKLMKALSAMKKS